MNLTEYMKAQAERLHTSLRNGNALLSNSGIVIVSIGRNV